MTSVSPTNFFKVSSPQSSPQPQEQADDSVQKPIPPVYSRLAPDQQNPSGLKKLLDLSVKYSSPQHTFMPITQTFNSTFSTTINKTESSEKAAQNPLLNAGNRKHTYPNGDIYEGEFKEGKRNGEGIMIYYGTGNTYTGTWKDDQQNGKGIMEYYAYTSPTPVKTYDGLWKDGQYHGEGVLRYYNKCRCVGNFSQGKFLGTIEYDSGDKYQGDYIETNFTIKGHGKGKYIYSDGDFNDGIFEQGNLKKGFIKMKCLQRDIFYEGSAERIDNALCRHGQGKCTYADGEIREGIWEKNLFKNGTVKIKHKDKSSYEGEIVIFDKGIYRHGRGKYICSDGEIYDGVWIKNNFQKGFWKYTTRFLESYEGQAELIDGILYKHGQGKLTLYNGKIFEGIWNKNQFQNPPNKPDSNHKQNL